MSEDKETTYLSLPTIPKDEFYEDWCAAVLATSGLFLERRLSLNNPINILELDIVTTKFSNKGTEKSLSEIKSGDWGLTDVFKVRGWLDYLHYDKASFVVLDSQKQQFVEFQNVASSLQIGLVNVQKDANGKLDNTPLTKLYGLPSIDKKVFDCSVATLRYAFCMERLMLEKYLKPLAKDPQGLVGYTNLKNYISEIRDYSFFVSDIHQRLLTVFGSFQHNKNISARLDTESNTGNYPDADKSSFSYSTFQKIFYEIPAKQHPLHISLYSEIYNRLIMLKLSIEEAIKDNTLTGLMKTIRMLSLPSNIRQGVRELMHHPYYYLYPVLWQNFIFVMGGFILTDKIKEEYYVLSQLSGIPESEIDHALQAFDLLFPIAGGKWLIDKPNTSIRIMQFMSLPFSGLGANFRRLYYRPDDNHYLYDDLKGIITGKYTINDMAKFNNLAVEYLSKAKELIDINRGNAKNP